MIARRLGNFQFYTPLFIQYSPPNIPRVLGAILQSSVIWGWNLQKQMETQFSIVSWTIVWYVLKVCNKKKDMSPGFGKLKKSTQGKNSGVEQRNWNFINSLVCVIYNIIWKHMIQAAKQLAQSAIDQSDQAQPIIVNNGNQPIITLCSSLCEVLYYGSWPFCRAQGSCWTDDWTSHCLGIPNDSKGCMSSESSYAFQHFLLLFTTFYRVTNFNNEGPKKNPPSGKHTKSYWKWPIYSWFTH